jgi:DNA helicase II / ATP-dependent DNA helicase PcrA
MKDDEYEAIVGEFEKPVLVLAGPGAGKTYLIGDRTRRLIENNVDKDTITLLTYGKEASLNMKDKLLDKNSGFGLPYDKIPNIATLHGISFEIVNRNPHIVNLKKTDLKVQSKEEVKKLLFRDSALILNLDEENSIKALQYKQNGKFDEEIGKEIYSICEMYWEIMSKCNYIDFDDQVYFACKILEKDTLILNEYQSKCKHLLIDEYQDINEPQFILIQLLSSKGTNGLFVVGDDAQSIYGFRGANPGYILNFQKNYPKGIMPPLAHSRRCPKSIINDASKMLKSYYVDWTGPYELKYHQSDGELPEIWQLPSDQSEAKRIAIISSNAIAEKKSVLILAPKKEFFIRIASELRRFGVPHRCPINLLPKALNEKLAAINDILNWLKNPQDNFQTRLAIEAIINNGQMKIAGAVKNRKCRIETIEKRVNIEREVGNLWNNVNNKNSLFNVLLEHNKLSIELDAIRKVMLNFIELFENKKNTGNLIQYLALIIGRWDEAKKVTDDLLLIIDQLNIEEPMGFNSVQLMTMRKAKGLEADVVIIAGLEDDLVPNPISNLEEEARLFYVSMTRAKEKLYLFHAYKRMRNISYGDEITDKKRSRFLDSIGRKSIYKKQY